MGEFTDKAKGAVKEAVGEVKQRFDALAHQGLIVDQANADHGDVSSGRWMSSAKPCPRAVRISTRPP